MPNNTARKIFNIQEGEQNLKVYDPAVTRGDLIKYDEELTIGGGGTVNSVTATAPLTSSGGVNPNIAMPAATAVVDGYLTAADWLTFNGKQGALTLTTVGSSGPATLVGNILNIPNYAGGSSYTFSTGLTDTAGTVTNNLSTGVAGGQSVVGGTAASNNLTLSSTTNATKGNIVFGNSFYQESDNRASFGGGILASSEKYNFQTDSSNDIFAIKYSNADTFSSAIVASKSRGTIASPFAVLANDRLGFFGFAGYDGTTYQRSAAIIASAANNYSGTSQGSFFGFFTTPIGSTFASRREIVRFFDSANVLIQNGGTFTDAGFRLDVNGTGRFQERVTISDDSTVTTQTVAVITTDTTNAGLVLRPNGTGAIMASTPDGTATGGDPRGTRAVDFQRERTSNTQVASGGNSFIGSGFGNTANNSGCVIVGGGDNLSNNFYSVIVAGRDNVSSSTMTFIGAGRYNTAIGAYSQVPGGENTLAYLYGQNSRASGSFGGTSVRGDAQTSSITYRRSITGQAATELFLDGSSARAILNISSPGPTNARVWNAMIQVVAIVSTVGAGTVTLNDVFSGTYNCAIKRIASPASTSIIDSVNTAGEVSDTSMSTSIVTIDADTANSALRIQFTPPTTAAIDTVIRVVATAYLTEVGR